MSTHRLVNWQGQMKVSDKNLQQTEDFFIAGLQDTRAIFLDQFSYGLLPSQNSADDNGGIRIREHITDHIEISLHHCNAVTASGSRIDFSEGSELKPLTKIYSPKQDAAHKGRDAGHFDVILSIDPFKRVPTGELNPKEEPPRHPDSESAYSLHVVPADELNISAFGSHYLTIGRIRKEAERYAVDTNYIPPCRTMSAHGELTEYFRRFEMYFSDLQASSVNIVEKVNNRGNGSELATDIRSISETILSHMASIHFEFSNGGAHQPPVVMARYISTLAYLCYVKMVCLPKVRKDELLRYFYEWSDVTPGSFEELLADTMEIKYDHNSIRSVMVRLESFMTTLYELWKRLSRLEYIGQHKESLIVSVRGGEQSSGEQRRGWSVSD